MKFGLAFANSSRRVAPDNAVALATMAEEFGFESLWTVEHTVVPAGYESKYPYDPSGKMPGTEESPIADPLIWLAYVAAATSTIKLATGIVILPQRLPLTLGKEVATLDVLSRGRVILGVGVGWLREEFDALGVPFEERGARTDEYIEALRAVWTQEEPTYEGRFTAFSRAKSYPKPVQQPVPIVIGGHSEAAARRAGRLGDGFYPFNVDEPLRTLELFDVMKAAAKDAGRDPDSIELTTAAMVTDPDMLKRFVDAGVSRMILPPMGKTNEDLKSFLGQMSETVIARFS